MGEHQKYPLRLNSAAGSTLPCERIWEMPGWLTSYSAMAFLHSWIYLLDDRHQAKQCVKNMLDMLGISDNGAGQGDAAAWDTRSGEVTVCDTDREDYVRYLSCPKLRGRPLEGQVFVCSESFVN